MIPKVIHYCWFGGKPLSDDAKKCIESWKKFCPDYKIVEWNETNFDINYCDYVKEAYDSKKWAFVTDVVRLYALVNYGGVYMDSDVEVIKPIDSFLNYNAFSGFQTAEYVPTGIMACEPHNSFFEELLNEYNGIHFINSDGSFDYTTNCVRITNACVRYGLELNNSLQTINTFTLFPSDYFCAKDSITGEVKITDNTCTIHHFAGSWITRKNKINTKIDKTFFKLFGISLFELKKKILKK